MAAAIPEYGPSVVSSRACCGGATYPPPGAGPVGVIALPSPPSPQWCEIFAGGPGGGPSPPRLKVLAHPWRSNCTPSLWQPKCPATFGAEALLRSSFSLECSLFSAGAHRGGAGGSPPTSWRSPPSAMMSLLVTIMSPFLVLTNCAQCCAPVDTVPCPCNPLAPINR
jgi:hypothetical protein